MNEIDSNKIKSILFDLSKKFILPMYNNLKEVDIMHKENNDLVTSVDLRVEEELNNILQKLLPNSLFVGEEKFSKHLVFLIIIIGKNIVGPLILWMELLILLMVKRNLQLWLL